MNNKKWMIPFAALLFLFLPIQSVSAHVTLHPEESSTDAWEKYTVRVPVEKDMNTTKVELQVPDEINLVNVMPKEGWDYELEKDEEGVITSVTWQETDGGIGPNEFTEFYIVAANPSEPTDVSWNAYQTYEDDSVVEWDGEPDADEPAPVVEITEEETEASHGDNVDTDTNAETSDDSEDETSNAGMGGWLPITLSGLALLLAIISLFRKRS
jgi:uncharacterized protein YcnI